MITLQEMIGHAKRLGLAHERALSPLGKEVGIPQTALGMLLFFANNPDSATARDVCELSGMKRALVSTHVERLVSEGLLERKSYPGDRRKDMLVPTKKAQPIIDAGIKAQEQLSESVISGLTEEELALMKRCFQIMDSNIDALIKSSST